MRPCVSHVFGLSAKKLFVSVVCFHFLAGMFKVCCSCFVTCLLIGNTGFYLSLLQLCVSFHCARVDFYCCGCTLLAVA